MGLIEKVGSWWEQLGLTRAEAEIMEGLLPSEPVPHPRCENCTNTVDPNSIHDCRGVYDEVRVFLGQDGGNIARSTRNRLSKKYNCEYGTATMYDHIHAYREKDVAAFDLKVEEFKQLRKDSVYRAKMLEYDWSYEEHLWNQ